MGRFLLHFSALAFLLGLPATVLAEDDLNYKPYSNFRPENVTGLTDLYAWVGSYYNATTEIELKPTTARSPDHTLCSPLQNYTSISKWDSILSITERGPYNSGSDPVNIFLSLLPPNYNLSSVPWQKEILWMSPLMWPLVSSELRWKLDENKTANKDYFDFTVAKTPQAYNLSGTIEDVYEPATTYVRNITMPVCNTTEETGDWEIIMVTYQSWFTETWRDFKYPNFTVLFDDKTANLTLDGVFFAYPYMRTNVSGWLGPHMVGSAIKGTIQIRFSGVMDTYHSDVLSTNSSTPTWLRTVGFGNNTENIGYGSGADTRSRPGLAIFITAFVVSLFAMYV